MKKIFVMGCSLWVAAFACAGTPAKRDSLKVVNLQGVQVVSTRASDKTPVAFTNLSKKEIQTHNYGQDIPFLLQLTPSVVVSSDAGAGIGYTGIRVRGSDASRVNITANGVPINDAESNSVYWVNMPDFASSLGSIQIQRGIGTSTNGSGAFGGSINMQTENLSAKPFAEVDASAGSYGTHKETFKFGTGLLNKHWAFEGRLSNIGSDGYIRRAFSKLNSYFLQAGYLSDNTVIKFITFNGTEDTYHAWNYTTKEDMAKYGRRYNTCGQYFNGTDTLYYNNQTDKYHQQHYQLLWNQTLSPSLNLNVALHYTHGFGYYEEYKQKQSLYKYNLVTDATKSDLIRQKKMDNDFYGTIFSLNYKKNHVDASLGGGWNKYDGDHYGNVTWVKSFAGSLLPNYEYYRNNGKKTEGNIYGKVNYELSKGLYAYVDLQYRHLNYKLNGPSDKFDDNKKQIAFDWNNSFDFFNPKAGLYWNITPNHLVYSSYAIAHKEPNRNNYEDNLTIVPKAERMNDWELGYQYHSSVFSAGVNGYYMYYHNQLVMTGEISDTGRTITRNVGKSYREGIELSAAYTPCKYFRWDANATLSRNRAKDWTVKAEDDGTPVNLGNTHLSYSPETIANNIFTFNYKNFTAALISQYVSKQYMTNTDDDNCVIDGFMVSNLNLGYSFKLPYTKQVNVGVTVYNLFNEKYESSTGYAENAYNHDGSLSWSYAAYSAQAPTNFLAHVSILF
jgi:iron complex outermembrane receptor protein